MRNLACYCSQCILLFCCHVILNDDAKRFCYIYIYTELQYFEHKDHERTTVNITEYVFAEYIFTQL